MFSEYILEASVCSFETVQTVQLISLFLPNASSHLSHKTIWTFFPPFSQKLNFTSVKTTFLFLPAWEQVMQGIFVSKLEAIPPKRLSHHRPWRLHSAAAASLARCSFACQRTKETAAGHAARAHQPYGVARALVPHLALPNNGAPDFNFGLRTFF